MEFTISKHIDQEGKAYYNISAGFKFFTTDVFPKNEQEIITALSENEIEKKAEIAADDDE